MDILHRLCLAGYTDVAHSVVSFVREPANKTRQHQHTTSFKEPRQKRRSFREGWSSVLRRIETGLNRWYRTSLKNAAITNQLKAGYYSQIQGVQIFSFSQANVLDIVFSIARTVDLGPASTNLLHFLKRRLISHLCSTHPRTAWAAYADNPFHSSVLTLFCSTSSAHHLPTVRISLITVDKL